MKRIYQALLSRVSRPADGSPAVLIGDSDVTAMPMAEAANLSYTSRLPLLAGDSDVTVWMVSTGNRLGMSGFAAPVISI